MLKLRWPGARKAAAGIAAAAALAVVATAVPALADPPAGAGGKAVVPASFDMVGVGSNTDDGLFNQLTADYDKTIAASEHGASHPYFYSFNATKPGSTSTAPTKIVTKSGCASIVRPNGSGPGLKALDNNTPDGKGTSCLDFARSSSGPSATSPSSRRSSCAPTPTGSRSAGPTSRSRPTCRRPAPAPSRSGSRRWASPPRAAA